jgi:hypothetical protein
MECAGMTAEDADTVVAVEASSVDEPYLGSDSARICVRLRDCTPPASTASLTSDLSELPCAAHAVIACIDLEGAIPRVFVAFLLLLGGRTLSIRVRHALVTGGPPADFASLSAALDTVPELEDLRDDLRAWLIPNMAT